MPVIVTLPDPTGIAPCHARWACHDDDYCGPGSPYGSGASEQEAVASYLASLPHASLNALYAGALTGDRNAVWLSAIRLELFNRNVINEDDNA